MLPKHLGMNHAAILVKDLDRALNFYREVLKFDVHPTSGKDWAMVTSGMTYISLIPNKKEPRDVDLKSKYHPAHIGINLEKIEHVDDYYHYLIEKEVTIVVPPKSHRDGSRGFYFYDSERNLLELIYIPL